MSTFLTVPSALDALALSASSSSLSSSSAYSFFGSRGRLSDSSQTDTSPPLSPLQEDSDADCYDGCPANNKTERLKQDFVLATPLSPGRLCGLESVVEDHVAVDESGYEADSEETLVASGRKKVFMKRRVSCLSRLKALHDRLESSGSVGSAAYSKNLYDSTALPLQPVLRPTEPKSLLLNSPSPIIALPSPRISMKANQSVASRFPTQPCVRPFSLSPFVSPIDHLPSPVINKPFDCLPSISSVPLCTRDRPMGEKVGLGLGLKLPDHASATLPEPEKATCTREQDLVGLGITLSPLSAETARADTSETRKRDSLAGLGLGIPSTRLLSGSRRTDSSQTSFHESAHSSGLAATKRDKDLTQEDGSLVISSSQGQDQSATNDCHFYRQRRRTSMNVSYNLGCGTPYSESRRQLFTIHESPTHVDFSKPSSEREALSSTLLGLREEMRGVVYSPVCGSPQVSPRVRPWSPFSPKSPRSPWLIRAWSPDGFRRSLSAGGAGSTCGESGYGSCERNDHGLGRLGSGLKTLF